MKNHLMAAAAVLALMSASSVAYAGEEADVKALKAQAAELKKQNAALEQRLNKLEAQQTGEAAASPTDYLAQVTKGPLPVLTDDGPICWKGVCVFGAIDGGLNYNTHGLPLNSKFYLGNEFLNAKARSAYFGFNPNGLSTSTLGVKGETEILPGLSGVFMASTNINPQSGQLADAPGSLTSVNGLSPFNWSNVGDGSRGGQAFNDQLYVGLSSKEFGTLTFGRHRSFATDLVGAYDATGGASAFSAMGYSGTLVSGQAFTENGRWDDSFKYKVSYGPVRFGAMYKFADGNSGSNLAGGNLTTHNDAAQFDLGASYAGFDIDGVIGYYNQATSVSPIGSADYTAGRQSFTTNKPGVAAVTTIGNNLSNTLAGTIADATGGAIGAKYTWNQWKLYTGWSHIILHNPSNPVGVGAQNDQGGYILSSVTNNAYYRAKLLDGIWFGTRYAYDPKTDIVAEYQHYWQNAYGSPTQLATCGQARVNTTTGAAIRSGACAGSIDSGSVYVDYHFTKRFDVYGGVLFNSFNGGMASGFFYTTNWSPTVGARFVF
ncbi:putative porin [Rhodoblastus acidophilus]|uniref:porin n=1 Tax=Rhodoblastus acidophilus TaxID=1074 RepID=UPI0022257F8B|nr:porin [Rhodoblastus acidophilus]MCW2284389.1 putative porin [Rhodoblastus acidophilus]MCW2333133.1 putative porin [Rhodoblastus acidophilus]